MKKLLTLLIFSIIALNSFAQDTDFVPETYIGFKIGSSSHSIKGKQVELIKSRGDDVAPHQDIVFGAVLTTDLSRLFRLKVEANRIVKGADYVGGHFYENQDKVVTYFQLPVLAGFKLPTYSNLGIAIEGGVATNYAIKPYEYNRNNFVQGTTINTTSFMISPVAGIELNYTYNHIQFFVNYRYEFDNQKFFERFYDHKNYYMQHSGGDAITGGILIRVSKKQ